MRGYPVSSGKFLNIALKQAMVTFFHSMCNLSFIIQKTTVSCHQAGNSDAQYCLMPVTVMTINTHLVII
jgi:hypothetical protein